MILSHALCKSYMTTVAQSSHDVRRRSHEDNHKNKVEGDHPTDSAFEDLVTTKVQGCHVCALKVRNQYKICRNLLACIILIFLLPIELP